MMPSIRFKGLFQRKHGPPQVAELDNAMTTCSDGKVEVCTTVTPGTELTEKSPEELVDEAGILYDDTKLIEEESKHDEEIALLPLKVRQLVNLNDDPTLSTITFRYFLLVFIFVIPGAFLSQMSIFRTTQAPYSIFFVQIASHYVGHFFARALPAYLVQVPFTKWSFNLNPGPWSIKEHVLVTLTAASGVNYNLGFYPLALAELYYGEKVKPAVGLFFMFSIVWCGYALAAIARQVLLYDPEYIWPQALMQSTLFETFRKTDEHSPVAKKQMKVFFLCLLGMTIWEFLPEYLFPLTSSLAFLCWVAPESPVANFMGSGLGGLSFLNLSLDWSNINWNGSSIFLTPWWTQVILFLAFAFNCWVLLPAAKWGNLGSYKEGLMSNELLLANGSSYPVLDILTPDLQLNLTTYEQLGPPYTGLQYIWAIWFDYAKFPAAFVWIATFGFVSVAANFRKTVLSRNKRSKVNGQNVHYQYHDRLNVIQRKYKEVPWWWFFLLFLAGFIVLLTTLACGYLWIPLWTMFVALGFGAIVVIPMGWLYAISNYQVSLGSFNELMYGYMVNTDAGVGHRHPAGPSVYSAIAGDAWYRAQTMLQDQKIGHYMHIPPRTVFFSQVFGSILGISVDYGVMRWVIDTKFDYLTGQRPDPNKQWTGQQIQTYNTMGVQYAVIGPKRLFAEALFAPLPWSFLAGACAPLLLYLIHRCFPRWRVDLWNVTIFCSGMAQFYGNISTGYTSAIIGGYVVMYWCYRKRFEVWKRYSYMIAAAFDAGFNFNLLLIFLFFGAAKQISMPNWWGNNAISVERCFALNS